MVPFGKVNFFGSGFTEGILQNPDPDPDPETKTFMTKFCKNLNLKENLIKNVIYVP
jgi:hypothetical protein